MSVATMWAERLAIIIAVLNFTTLLHAEKRKSVTFASIDGSWVLKVRDGEGQYIEKNIPQIWRGSLGNVSEGIEVRSTFVWTYVVAGEADELSHILSMIFAREDCRDSKGRSHPFSVILRFGDSPAERGCGNWLP